VTCAGKHPGSSWFLSSCWRAVPGRAEDGRIPGHRVAWAASPESLGWFSDKLATARAYSERIGISRGDDCGEAWSSTPGVTWSASTSATSMRKSLISALYGIYAADGKIDLGATLKELALTTAHR